MAIDNNLRVDELNFEGIKDNFKRYLQAQDQFRDYNFDGSGMSVLLDLLAYNTYYNSFYLNMVSAEAFLATAQKRNSVVNLAKSLNYIPRSISSASVTGTATLTVTGSPATVLIPAYTKFTGTIDGSTYTFLSLTATTVTSNAGKYSSTLVLNEGTYIIRRYIVNSSDTQQRFLIENTNIDTTTISVKVLNSTTDSTTRVFSKPDNLVDINSTSQVYFLEEAEDGQYEIKFGDGTFGLALNNGNVVVIEFIVTSGTLANDVVNLTYADSIAGVTSITFVANDPAAGGAAKELTSQVKFNAPKSYEAQNRAITSEDYKALLLKQPNVDSVVVWGGEDNDPPSYGKVYIAIRPTSGTVLTATEKQNLITSIINPKKVLTISHEIVDPEYLYITVTSTVKYEADKTTLSSDAMAALITTTVKNYNDSDINQFGRYFRYSKLTRLIDASERSILNNDTTIVMRKELDVQLGNSAKYQISFSNPIDATTKGRPASQIYGFGNKVTSNAFTYLGYSNCFLEDNNGIIRIYRETANENIAVQINAGSIDYDTGIIILTAFAPTAFADGGTTLKITATPANKDILPLRNQILTIEDADITISMVDDKTISLVNR
jgi:hypothetical protein